jgi:hypothetical protein
LLHPEDAGRVIAATWRTTFQRIVYEETYRMISRDSRIVWIRDRADVERLPDNSEVWRGSWTVIAEPELGERSQPSCADMPRQNRVTPLGVLIADPGRGTVYGNRGCLHDEAGRIRRRYAGRRWIACRLAFRGWHRGPLMQPGRFTELFFLDEATAFAAGHRPCALCRREDYERFVAIWRRIHPGQAGADAIDAQLHLERVDPETRAQRHHDARLDELPDGSFVVHQGESHLVLGSELLRWTPSGYRDVSPRPSRARALLITPPSSVEVLRAGWEPVVPLLHASALAASERTLPARPQPPDGGEEGGES